LTADTLSMSVYTCYLSIINVGLVEYLWFLTDVELPKADLFRLI